MVPEMELRQKLTHTAVNSIVPPYTVFYDKYSVMQFSKKNKDKYIKYTPDQVQQMLEACFKGETIMSSVHG
jgi:exocyst complex protein 7